MGLHKSREKERQRKRDRKNEEWRRTERGGINSGRCKRTRIMDLPDEGNATRGWDGKRNAN